MYKQFRQQLITLLPALALIIMLPSCGGLGKMEKTLEDLNVKVSPDHLVLRGDQVEITITGTFPAKYFHKKAILEVTPVLVWEGGESAFRTQGFQGEDAAGNHDVVPFAVGKRFNYSASVDFQDAMEDVAHLELRIKGTLGNKSVDFAPVELGHGVITTQNLLVSDDRFILAEDAFQRVVSYTQNAEINYAYNSSAVKRGEFRDEDIMELGEFLVFAAANDSVVLNGTAVSAFASPEGEMSMNSELALERAVSANKAVARLLRKVGISVEDVEAFYGNEPKGEDWAGFKTLMNASDIADKALILRVLSMYTDDTRREEEIRNISKTYKVIEDEILPQLRRSQIVLNYEIEGYTDAELVALCNSNPGSLTIEEVLYGATLIEGAEAKLTVYQAGAAAHGGDWRALNNAGVCLMDLGRMNQAAEQFEAARALQADAVVINNLGAIARMRGDLSGATSLLGAASAAGDDVRYNKALVQVQQGNYSGAVSNMSGQNTANAALAKLLNGDANGAKTTMDNAGDDSAVATYISAIIAAHLGDDAGADSYRDAAVEKDSSLARKAKADLEFEH
jgi:Flp pilus assembly protein TadD